MHPLPYEAFSARRIYFASEAEAHFERTHYGSFHIVQEAELQLVVQIVSQTAANAAWRRAFSCPALRLRAAAGLTTVSCP